MKLLRTLLSLLLLITLPVYGMAGLNVDTKSPCPMQMDANTKAQHPCCADQHDGSNPCKPGQECKTAGLFPLMAARSAPVLPVAEFSPLTANAQTMPRHSNLIWHPPRL